MHSDASKAVAAPYVRPPESLADLGFSRPHWFSEAEPAERLDYLQRIINAAERAYGATHATWLPGYRAALSEMSGHGPIVGAQKWAVVAK